MPNLWKKLVASLLLPILAFTLNAARNNNIGHEDVARFTPEFYRQDYRIEDLYFQTDSTPVVTSTDSAIPLPSNTEATPTLIPMPPITMQFPQITAQGIGDSINQEPGSPAIPKNNLAYRRSRIIRFLPILGIFLTWMILFVWVFLALGLLGWGGKK